MHRSLVVAREAVVDLLEDLAEDSVADLVVVGSAVVDLVADSAMCGEESSRTIDCTPCLPRLE